MVDLSIPACGPLIERLEQDLGLPTETIARALDVDQPTIERWRANQGVPQGTTYARLVELVALRDRLVAMMGTTDAAREWLRAGSRYLGGITPEEALSAGHLDWVQADLDGLAAGVYV